MNTCRHGLAFIAAATTVLAAQTADAHGLIGKRFFPATLAIEDPFVADEMSLPTVFSLRRPAEDGGRETVISGELAKRLSPDLGLGVGGAFTILDPDHGETLTGFDNLEVSVKYVFFKNADHETIFSLGLDAGIGGTGSEKIDAEPFSVLAPVLFLGKGFGDLPDRIELARPLALTGQFGVGVPTRRQTQHTTADGEVECEFNPNVALWGFTLQYNLQYLQSFVRDVGLPRPFNRMIPIMEFVMETPLGGAEGGRTTGTINPGLIWFGRYVQVGLEAVIPVNSRSGEGVGILGQLHFYLDDIAPRIFTWTPFHGTLGPAVPR
jgi:hypothetical protein